jgi:glycosyltransferase involved in cell wall biosynthesis
VKILLVARWPVGGIRTYFRYIYSQSIFRNDEFILVAPDIDLKCYLEKYLPNIKLIVSENSDKALRQAVIKIINTQSFDAVHSHGFSAGAIVSSIISPFRVPHIMTAHDVFRDDQFVGIKGKVKSWLLNLAYWRMDGILTVGEDALSNFKQYIPLVSEKKIHNIDHGVDTARFFHAKKRDFHTELNLHNYVLIGFLGRFMSQKGFLDVIKAMKILLDRRKPEQMPIVLTFGWGGFIREDYALIEQLKLSPYFRQLPFTDDVASAIKGVNMVVMPSRWEACGLLAMEVLSAGTPLISTNCIGLRCVVENTPAKIVDAYCPDQLADAIEDELNASTRATFQAFQATAVERFNLSRPALELHQYYQTFKDRSK